MTNVLTQTTFLNGSVVGGLTGSSREHERPTEPCRCDGASAPQQLLTLKFVKSQRNSANHVYTPTFAFPSITSGNLNDPILCECSKGSVVKFSYRQEFNQLQHNQNKKQFIELSSKSLVWTKKVKKAKSIIGSSVTESVMTYIERMDDPVEMQVNL
jgi:hypothetical protein